MGDSSAAPNASTAQHSIAQGSAALHWQSLAKHSMAQAQHSMSKYFRAMAWDAKARKLEQAPPSCTDGRAGQVGFGRIAWGARGSETDYCIRKFEIAFIAMCVDLVNDVESAAILQECVNGCDILVLI